MFHVTKLYWCLKPKKQKVAVDGPFQRFLLKKFGPLSGLFLFIFAFSPFCNGIRTYDVTIIGREARTLPLRQPILKFFLHGPFSVSFFFIFVFLVLLKINEMFHIKYCRWLDSNREPLVSQVTALATKPQPLPRSHPFLKFEILLIHRYMIDSGGADLHLRLLFMIGP